MRHAIKSIQFSDRFLRRQAPDTPSCSESTHNRTLGALRQFVAIILLEKIILPFELYSDTLAVASKRSASVTSPTPKSLMSSSATESSDM
jgi:hypothetical protein